MEDREQDARNIPLSTPLGAHAFTYTYTHTDTQTQTHTRVEMAQASSPSQIINFGMFNVLRKLIYPTPSLHTINHSCCVVTT